MDHDQMKSVVTMVCAAGGTLNGRTRLQKIAALLSLTGFNDDFSFYYHHYGPYSDELSAAVADAKALRLIQETPMPTGWGGTYSVFGVLNGKSITVDKRVQKLVQRCATESSVVLELAVTAAFLSKEGCAEPWNEVIRRKSPKANVERIGKAKAFYRELLGFDVPEALPSIA